MLISQSATYVAAASYQTATELFKDLCYSLLEHDMYFDAWEVIDKSSADITQLLQATRRMVLDRIKAETVQRVVAGSYTSTERDADADLIAYTQANFIENISQIFTQMVTDWLNGEQIIPRTVFDTTLTTLSREAMEG